MRVATLTELASGVDALYLSGRASLTTALLDELEALRTSATDRNEAAPLVIGGETLLLKPHAFGKYRYCLVHKHGRIGVTMSQHLPALRIQPRAEFLHGAGTDLAVAWFRDLAEALAGEVFFTVSRVDLFADFQGWDLTIDSRREFVCRAVERAGFETNEDFNGLQFGKRDSGTVSARLYDKVAEVAKSGSAYWFVIWGDRYDASRPVLRVEFELHREALRQYGVNTPEEVLGASGALWGSLTRSWLSHRVPTVDATRSRWPVSPAWQAVQRARVGDGYWGIARIYDEKRAGVVAKLMPGLTGYLTSYGALRDCGNFGDVVTSLSDDLNRYALRSGRTLGERISERRVELGVS